MYRPELDKKIENDHILSMISFFDANVYEGEDITTAIDSPVVNKARTILKATKTTLLSKGWYFNKKTETFSPDSNGMIKLPPNILSIHYKDLCIGEYYVTAGGYLSEIDGKYEFSKAIELDYIVNTPYSLLSALFNQYLKLSATVNYGEFILDNHKILKPMYKEVKQLYINLLDEHNQYTRPNFIKNTYI
ncbi:MAG: hypothetical protein ABW127_09870 [Candidatus Thiodiazotropha endolucinida]